MNDLSAFTETISSCSNSKVIAVRVADVLADVPHDHLDIQMYEYAAEIIHDGDYEDGMTVLVVLLCKCGTFASKTGETFTTAEIFDLELPTWEKLSAGAYSRAIIYGQTDALQLMLHHDGLYAGEPIYENAEKRLKVLRASIAGKVKVSTPRAGIYSHRPPRDIVTCPAVHPLIARCIDTVASRSMAHDPTIRDIAHHRGMYNPDLDIVVADCELA